MTEKWKFLFTQRNIFSWGETLSLGWIFSVSEVMYTDKCGICSLHNTYVSTLWKHLNVACLHTSIILVPWYSQAGSSKFQIMPMISNKFEASLGNLCELVWNFKIREGQRDSPEVEHFPSKALSSKFWVLKTIKLPWNVIQACKHGTI